MNTVLDGACDVMEVWDPDGARSINPHALEKERTIGELAEFIRKIGARATPDVLAQQLVILKRRETADLSRPEAIALQVFATVLMELDQFAAEEKARAAAAKAVPEERKPIPIEDTTLETVDGPFDTWGKG